MKKKFLFGCALLMCANLTANAAGEETVANLQAAYKGESTASAAYAAFADQALKEGYTQIAVLFHAASKSESIHAANHKTVLVKLGQAVPDIKPEFTVKTTKENLEAAVAGETNEALSMYPAYIATAKSANELDAAKSMRWAMETEKKHMIYYQNALFALKGNSVASLPKFYWVCPKCGNTYDIPSTESMCSFCGTANSKFIKVNK
jgi:rubrerythrin